MNWLHNVRLRLRRLVRNNQFERDLNDELQFHVEMQTQENLRRGMSPDQARTEARKSIGGLAQVQEECRRVRAIGWIESLLHDLRYGARVLSRNPGFMLVAVLTLALGIGANTAIFSVVNAVLLQPLPYPDADRIVMLWQANPELGYDEDQVCPADFHVWEEESRTFERFGYIANNSPAIRNFYLDRDERTIRIRGRFTSAGVFDVLGVEPLLGRTIRQEEDLRGAETVAVLSYTFWRRTFAGDGEILGQRLNIPYLRQQGAAIVGVMPPEFRFPEDCDVWLSFSAHPWHTPDRVSHDFWVVARLKPVASISEARAEMNALQQRLAASHPDTPQVATHVRIVPLLEQFVGSGTRPTLWILLSAVGGVLLIACGNVANLLLARGLARHKEIAVRLAVGAGRMRLVRQLLTEALLLAVLGGIAGGLFAVLGVRCLPAFADDSGGGVKEFRVDRFQEIEINQTVLGFTVVIAVATSVLFGLAPALQASLIDLNATLKEEGRTSTDTARRRQLRNGLLVGQIALAMLLVVWAGLMVRSFNRALAIEIGFQPTQLLVGTVDLNIARDRYSGSSQDITLEIMKRAVSVPGVESAAAINELPTQESGGDLVLYVEGWPRMSVGDLPTIEERSVTPSYFETLDIPLLEGRNLSENDLWRESPLVVLINETASRRFFPDESPLGKRIITANTGFPIMRQPFQEIVGVVGDVRTFNPDQEVKPEVYHCYRQRDPRFWAGSEIVVPVLFQTSGDPRHVIDDLRLAIDQDAESGGIIENLHVYENDVQATAAPQRFRALLMGLFSLLSIILAAVGVYGVMAYSVNQRTREIGIRMALGASRSSVLRLVVGQGLVVTLLGIAIGLAGALAGGRVLANLLYGVEFYDPVTLCIVPLVLLLVGTVASFLPARRAMGIDPVEALRYE